MVDEAALSRASYFNCNKYAGFFLVFSKALKAHLVNAERTNPFLF